ncbi:peptide/nickel transport system substrate-binding protein [Symbiobacterium terraclitae]|uniref:Peptide/nickel transport system substrate-binding protein n=1 Tax=Symbiobacterium terraclitae TaxID=557451 RepID=A0ABS4JNL2_9FIRM|nr:peptide/nickel transport system substrate-binding protein [Symbiobacterium terraclitae]
MAALLCGLLLLTGCGSVLSRTKTAETPPAPSTLVYTTPGDASVLLPTLTVDTASSFVTDFIYDGLAVYDDQLNPHPALAESWEVEDDRIYTFKIRQGVTFHDGAPLTADDVRFTFLTIAHPDYQGVRFGDFTAVKGWGELARAYAAADAAVEEGRLTEAESRQQKLEAYEHFVQTGGLQVPDPYTFRVEAEYPFAPLFTRLTGYGIMPRHLLEPHISDLAGSPYATRPVGTGAMRLVEWKKNERIVLERNPDWHYSLTGRGGQIDRLIIQVVPGQKAAVAALERGETDVADIPPEMVAHFRANVPDVTLHEYATFAYTFLGYNLSHPIYSDIRVRRAITHALDRKAMIDQLLAGHGQVAHSHASPARWDYNPDLQAVSYDPAAAAQLLDQAGWLLGPDGLRYRDGQPFVMNLAVNVESQLRGQTALFIQEALRAVGIQVEIHAMGWDDFLAHISSDAKETYLLGWSLGFDPDPHSIFHSEGGFHPITGYSDPDCDRLIEEGRATTDQARRKQIYGRLQAHLAEQQVYTWLFAQDSVVGVSNRVQGVRHGSPRGLFWNWEEWSVNPAPKGAE